MTPSLKSITISNFRSISGTITVPFTAPVVLVHGPNGAGKTSVLSAIELALTGEIAAMRTDANYRSHLIHRGADHGRIVLDGVDLAVDTTSPHEIILKSNGIKGGALLSSDVAGFFSERCYLAQATLGRLLEIYQNASPRQESALTRFVKDLLGLDALDALIDGLHPVGDVRNVRRLSRGYAGAEATIRTIEERISRIKGEISPSLTQAVARRAAIRATLPNLSRLPDPQLGTDVPLDIEVVLRSDEDDRELITLSRQRHDLASLRERASRLSASQEAHDEAAARMEEQTARTAADKWRSTTGKLIDELIGYLRATFPDLPSVASTDPKMAFQTAATRVEAELERCVRTIGADDQLATQIEKLHQDIEQSRARVALADEQLMLITGEAEGLSRALASIIPHIHEEVCPVCGRDYHEVSDNSLVQYVSTQAARFTEQADRLQGLGRSRASAVSEQSKAERDREVAVGKRLSQDARGALKARISDLTEAKRRLNNVAEQVDVGATAIRREAEARRRLAEIRNRDRLAAELRVSVGELCSAMNQPTLGTSETISAAIQRLDIHVAAQEADAEARQTLRRDTLRAYELLHQQEKEIERLRNALSADEALKRRWDDAFASSEKHRQTARSIARAAANARTTIVGRVFNSSLNKMWRDLFVRLAPTEPFVPAFRLPQSATEPVTAQLETVHREGGTAGAPGSMLSAGNLNTAALTLFLALHLSVRPQLPWLILDDPVQSMDEVHIAQFAALLRTLSKEHHRQIVIAVHERPLFDYLTLELSPAFEGDKLITVELSRSNGGASVAEPNYQNWEPDRAVSVA